MHAVFIGMSVLAMAECRSPACNLSRCWRDIHWQSWVLTPDCRVARCFLRNKAKATNKKSRKKPNAEIHHKTKKILKFKWTIMLELTYITKYRFKKIYKKNVKIIFLKSVIFYHIIFMVHCHHWPNYNDKDCQLYFCNCQLYFFFFKYCVQIVFFHHKCTNTRLVCTKILNNFVKTCLNYISKHSYDTIPPKNPKKSQISFKSQTKNS